MKNKLPHKILESGEIDGIRYDYKLETMYGIIYMQNPSEIIKELKSLRNYCYRARPAGFPDKDENGEDEEA